jgi:hypothetical protein
VDFRGRSWIAPDHITIQGAPVGPPLAGPVSAVAYLGSLLPGAQQHVLTLPEIARVREALQLLIAAELSDRAKGSLFLAWLEACVGRIQPPPGGSRDKVNKDAETVGPFQNRAIKVNTMLNLLYAFFGHGFASLNPHQVNNVVKKINSIRTSGSPGEQFALDRAMYRLALSAGRFPAQLSLVENVWRKAGFSAAAIQKFGDSARCMVNILERTGYSQDTNLHLQQMLLEDRGDHFDAGDPQGNLRRIHGHAQRGYESVMNYLNGEGTFSSVVARHLGGRRSYSSQAGAADAAS